MTQWQVKQLTSGTADGLFHSHSYYDIGVFDTESRRIVGYQNYFTERPATPDDRVSIGVIDLAEDAAWRPIGESRAWSWQQGPMAQWLLGTTRVIWNDRDRDQFVTRVHDVETGYSATLPRPSYAVDPRGRFTLCLNMARLDSVRPGYGYPGGSGAQLHKRRPRNDGVWRQDLVDGNATLILSLHRAVRFMLSQLGWRAYLRHVKNRYRYWFNHVKLSPDGRRFTIKLRFRGTGKNSGWNDRMGVSLTCGIDGSDLRLLAHASSHVIWLDNESLYFWQRDGLYLYADDAPKGRKLRQLAPDLIDQNVHLRHLPGTTHQFIFDTPYQQEIDLLAYNDEDGSSTTIARFENHRPERGQYRCDLHPCPSPDGRKIVVTSLHDGGRQMYLLSDAT